MPDNDSYFQRKFSIFRSETSGSSVGSTINTGESSVTTEQTQSESEIVSSVIEYASKLKGEYEEKHNQLSLEFSTVKEQVTQSKIDTKSDIDTAKHSHMKLLLSVAGICLASIAAGAWALYSNLDAKYSLALERHSEHSKEVGKDISAIQTKITDIGKHDLRLNKIESDVGELKTNQAVTQNKFTTMNESLIKITKTVQNKQTN